MGEVDSDDSDVHKAEFEESFSRVDGKSGASWCTGDDDEGSGEWLLVEIHPKKIQ